MKLLFLIFLGGCTNLQLQERYESVAQESCQKDFGVNSSYSSLVTKTARGGVVYYKCKGMETGYYQGFISGDSPVLDRIHNDSQD